MPESWVPIDDVADHLGAQKKDLQAMKAGTFREPLRREEDVTASRGGQP